MRRTMLIDGMIDKDRAKDRLCDKRSPALFLL